MKPITSGKRYLKLLKPKSVEVLESSKLIYAPSTTMSPILMLCVDEELPPHVFCKSKPSLRTVEDADDKRRDENEPFVVEIRGVRLARI